MVIDVIGDNHVGVCSLLFPVHDAEQNFLQGSGVQPIIGIHKIQPFPLCKFDSGIARCGHPRIRPVNDLHPRPALCIPVGDLSGTVCGTVVHQNHLHQRFHTFIQLTDNTLKTLFQICLHIIDWYDDRQCLLHPVSSGFSGTLTFVVFLSC